MDWLLDTSDFVPRRECGDWSELLLIMALVSNLLIALAYFLIPAFLFIFWRKRRETVPHAYILILFVLFILFCGLTHLISAITFFWPVYRLLVLVDFITATLSFITVLHLPKVILHFLDLKTPGQYVEIANILENELKLEREMAADIEKVIRMLENRIRFVERELERKSWVEAQSLRLEELKETLSNLKAKYDPTYGSVFRSNEN